MMPGVDIVVVTFESRAHIGACLDSIAASEYDGPISAVVVDNASNDGTADLVRAHPSAVRLIENARNRGFAAACNQGIRATTGGFVLLLNPDARLEPDTVARLVGHLVAHPRAAIAGPKLLQPNGDLQRDISATGLYPTFLQALFEYTRLGRLFPGARWHRDYFLSGWDRRSTRRVAMVQGACLMVRRPVLRDLGGLDERYFLYFEETDLCKGAADAGLEIHYVGDASATHVGSQSMIGSRQSARHFIASLYRFHRKHYGFAEAASLWLVLAAAHGLRTARLAALAPWRPRDEALRADLRTARERFAAHGSLLVDSLPHASGPMGSRRSAGDPCPR